MMSEEVGGGGGGGPGNFLLDQNHLWPGFSNSDNSGGNSTEDKSGGNINSLNNKMKLPLDSSSNSPTPTPTPTATIPPSIPVVGQNQINNKRGRSGVPKSGTGKSKAGASGGGDWNMECKVGGGESDHEIHIWTERERRKKMRNMFSNLHALLPQLPAKADKSTIVDEAVNYIKTLQHSLQKLQKQRLEMLRGATLPSSTIDCEPSSIVLASTAPALNSREAFLADQASSSRNNSSMSNMNSPNALTVPCVPALFQTWSSPNVVLSVNGDDAQISVCAPKKPGLLSTVLYVLEKHKLEVVTAHVSSDFYRSMFMIHAHASGACDQFPEALPVEEIYKLAVGEMIFWISS